MSIFQLLFSCLFFCSTIMVAISDSYSSHNCTTFTETDLYPRILVINGGSRIGSSIVKGLKDSKFSSVKISVHDIKSVKIHQSLLNYDRDICSGDFTLNCDRGLLINVDWVIHIPESLEEKPVNRELTSSSKRNHNDLRALMAIGNHAVPKYIFVGNADRALYLNEQLGELRGDAGRNVSVVRLHNVYGAGYDDFQDPTSVSSMIRDAIANAKIDCGKDGSYNKDYIYISDVVVALVSVVQRDSFRGDLPIGTGMRTSSVDIARQIALLTEKCLKKKVVVASQDSKLHRGSELIAKTARAKKLLSWTPKVSIEHGIALTYAEFLRGLAKENSSGYKIEELESFAKCVDGVTQLGAVEKWVPLPIQPEGVFSFIPPPPGELSISLPKIFCPKDRQTVRDSLKDVVLPKKTLVVLIASTRANRITWENFRTNVLEALNADLALSVESLKYPGKDGFRDNATYIWNMNDPPDNDYVHFYNDISTQCYGHPFNDMYAGMIGSLSVGGTGWLGCIKATKHSSCCGSILFYRWFALQNILRLKLYLKYDTVVISRSDFYWVSKHTVLNMTDGTVYVPEGEEYGGMYDRHYVLTMRDAISALAHAEVVMEDKDPAIQMETLTKWGFKGVSNLEGAHNVWLSKVQHLNITRFKHSGLLVRDGSDPGIERWSGGVRSDVNGLKVLVKYQSELHTLHRNGDVKPT